VKNYVLLTEKKWHRTLYEDLIDFFPNDNWFLIDKKDSFNEEILDKIKPYKVFIPHWSYYIPNNIFNKYECILFHMTDLPFGRGGSPLQNLILRGFTETKITALKVIGEVDAGPIFCKKPLDLTGTASDIFYRSTSIIRDMIIEIITTQPDPYLQEGEVVYFNRRTPSQSDISELDNLIDVHNYIRMLDEESYPNAFIEVEKFKIEFYNSNFDNNKITANVRIIQK